MDLDAYRRSVDQERLDVQELARIRAEIIE